MGSKSSTTLLEVRTFFMSMASFYWLFMSKSLNCFQSRVDSRLVIVWQPMLIKCSIPWVSSSLMCGSCTMCIARFPKRGYLHIFSMHPGVSCWKPSQTYFHAIRMEPQNGEKVGWKYLVEKCHAMERGPLPP